MDPEVFRVNLELTIEDEEMLHKPNNQLLNERCSVKPNS
jgi:hypothetical protein